MARIKQFDKRTGTTYIYESKSYWDKEKKQSRAKRTLVGRLDKETGKIVETDGRGRHRRDYFPEAAAARNALPKIERTSACRRSGVLATSTGRSTRRRSPATPTRSTR